MPKYLHIYLYTDIIRLTYNILFYFIRLQYNYENKIVLTELQAIKTLILNNIYFLCLNLAYWFYL